MNNIIVKWFLTLLSLVLMGGCFYWVACTPHAEMGLIFGVAGFLVAGFAFAKWEEEHLEKQRLMGRC